MAYRQREAEETAQVCEPQKNRKYGKKPGKQSVQCDVYSNYQGGTADSCLQPRQYMIAFNIIERKISGAKQPVHRCFVIEPLMVDRVLA
jgi:hypothetical protein